MMIYISVGMKVLGKDEAIPINGRVQWEMGLNHIAVLHLKHLPVVTSVAQPATETLG